MSIKQSPILRIHAAEDTASGQRLAVHTLQKITSCSLTRLLSTDQCNDSAQLCALRCMLLHQSIRHPIRLRQLRSRLQHAVLQVQHLLERVVKERSRERDRVRRRLIETHLQLPRLLLLLRYSS